MPEHDGGFDNDREERREIFAEEGTSLALEEDRFYRDNLAPIEQRLWERNRAFNAGIGARRRARMQHLDVGPFLALADPSWAAQADLIKNKPGFAFNPSRLFENTVAAKADIRGLYDPSSPDYAQYEGLRTNLAVLRNTLLSQGMDAARLQSVAEVLGEALAHDRFYLRPITRWFDRGVANVEAVGAAEMYKFLLKAETRPLLPRVYDYIEGILTTIGIHDRLTELGIHFPDRVWQLKPLELTPFSDRNLEAAAIAGDGETVAPPSNFASRYLNSPKTGMQFSKA